MKRKGMGVKENGRTGEGVVNERVQGRKGSKRRGIELKKVKPGEKQKKTGRNDPKKPPDTTGYSRFDTNTQIISRKPRHEQKQTHAYMDTQRRRRPVTWPEAYIDINAGFAKYNAGAPKRSMANSTSAVLFLGGLFVASVTTRGCTDVSTCILVNARVHNFCTSSDDVMTPCTVGC